MITDRCDCRTPAEHAAKLASAGAPITLTSPDGKTTLTWTDTPCDGLPLTRTWHGQQPTDDVPTTSSCGDTTDKRDQEIEYLTTELGWK